jgi:hypothetical protein
MHLNASSPSANGSDAKSARELRNATNTSEADPECGNSLLEVLKQHTMFSGRHRGMAEDERCRSPSDGRSGRTWVTNCSTISTRVAVSPVAPTMRNACSHLDPARPSPWSAADRAADTGSIDPRNEVGAFSDSWTNLRNNAVAS